MSGLNGRVWVVVFVACSLGMPAPAATNRVGSLAHREYIASLWRRIGRQDAHLSSRNLFDFTLEALTANHLVGKIDQALTIAEGMQDRDSESATYGNFAWYLKDENRPDDRNAVEFCMQKASLAWKLHESRLPEDARRRLRRLIDFSVEGILRHRVKESYTNIYLMRLWNCIAIGENTGRPDLASEGYAMLDHWLLYTAQCGIHEYISPTYYGVDLECLGLVARHAGREIERRKARAALDLFWCDIAANWYEGGERLGGAHSRDYDYLTGHGHLDSILRQVGWLPGPERMGCEGFLSLCAVPARQELVAPLLSHVPRYVVQQWGESPAHRARHYVGKRFSIGSAGAAYGPMDKVLTVNLPGGPKAPMMYFMMDARNDPYGKRRYLTSGGHRKALHIEPAVTSAQRESEVVLVASVEAGSGAFRRTGDEAVCLLSHVVMPEACDVYVGENGEAVKGGVALSRVNERVPSIFVRCEDVAVAVRVLVADGHGDATARVELVDDGKNWGARRLTCVHAESGFEGRVSVCIWVRAAEGLTDEGFARFRQQFAAADCGVERTDNRLSVVVPGADGRPLRLDEDVLGGPRRTGAEECGDGVPPLLSVNGKRVGRECLGQVPLVHKLFERMEALRTLEPQQGVGEVFEAENGIVFPAFEVGHDADARGNRYIWVSGPKGEHSNRAARSVWALSVPTNGTYYVWGRIQAPTQKDDSFYVQVFQNKAVLQPLTEWHTGVHGTWEWVRFKPALVLKEGTILLEIRAREDGTRLDALCVGGARLSPRFRAGQATYRPLRPE